MKKRNYTIDILKGLAIILVVYYHTYILSGHMVFGYEWLQSFHMPLFSFASGFLTCGRTDMPFGKYFFKKGRALLVPYVVFFVIYLILMEIIAYHQHGFFAKPTWEWLSAFILSGKKLFDFQQSFRDNLLINTLWFFSTSFFAYVLFWFVTKLKGYAFFAGAIALGIISYIFQYTYGTGEFTTPFNMRIIPFFTFLMCFGAIFKTYLIGKVAKERKPLLSICLLLLGFRLVRLSGFHGSIRLWGTPMYVPTALIQITGLYGFFSVMKRCRLLEYLGRHSLYIYGLHMIFMYFVGKIIKRIGAVDAGNTFVQLATTAILIALCCVCFEAYERIKFKLVGK